MACCVWCTRRGGIGEHWGALARPWETLGSAGESQQPTVGHHPRCPDGPNWTLVPSKFQQRSSEKKKGSRQVLQRPTPLSSRHRSAPALAAAGAEAAASNTQQARGKERQPTTHTRLLRAGLAAQFANGRIASGRGRGPSPLLLLESVQSGGAHRNLVAHPIRRGPARTDVTGTCTQGPTRACCTPGTDRGMPEIPAPLLSLLPACLCSALFLSTPMPPPRSGRSSSPAPRPPPARTSRSRWDGPGIPARRPGPGDGAARVKGFPARSGSEAQGVRQSFPSSWPPLPFMPSPSQIERNDPGRRALLC